MDKVNAMVKPLNKYAEKVPQIVDVAKKAGVEPGLLLAGGLVVSSLLVVILFGATILTVMICVIYPAIKSIQALETTENEDDDKIWLTYWILFGIFSLLDEFGGIVLSFIPMYFYVKLAFFVYLMHPKTYGSLTIYRTFVKPIMAQHKDKIQAFIDDIKGSASEAMKEAKSNIAKELNDPANMMRAAQLASKAQEQAKKLETAE